MTHAMLNAYPPECSPVGRAKCATRMPNNFRGFRRLYQTFTASVYTGNIFDKTCLFPFPMVLSYVSNLEADSMRN